MCKFCIIFPSFQRFLVGLGQKYQKKKKSKKKIKIVSITLNLFESNWLFSDSVWTWYPFLAKTRFAFYSNKHKQYLKIIKQWTNRSFIILSTIRYHDRKTINGCSNRQSQQTKKKQFVQKFNSTIRNRYYNKYR